MKLGQRRLGPRSSAYIVAEMSGNHGGSIDKALKIIEAAKLAGADAIKLQTYTADTITFKGTSNDFLVPTNSPWAHHNNLWDLNQKNTVLILLIIKLVKITSVNGAWMSITQFS